MPPPLLSRRHPAGVFPKKPAPEKKILLNIFFWPQDDYSTVRGRNGKLCTYSISFGFLTTELIPVIYMFPYFSQRLPNSHVSSFAHNWIWTYSIVKKSGVHVTTIFFAVYLTGFQTPLATAAPGMAPATPRPSAPPAAEPILECAPRDSASAASVSSSIPCLFV